MPLSPKDNPAHPGNQSNHDQRQNYVAHVILAKNPNAVAISSRSMANSNVMA